MKILQTMLTTWIPIVGRSFVGNRMLLINYALAVLPTRLRTRGTKTSYQKTLEKYASRSQSRLFLIFRGS